MLGREAKNYTTKNNFIPKTEMELLEELESLVKLINNGYSKNETIEDCAEILCMYFKSSIMNNHKTNINNNLVNNSLYSSNNSFMNETNVNNLLTNSSLFFHKMKYLVNKNKRNQTYTTINDKQKQKHQGSIENSPMKGNISVIKEEKPKTQHYTAEKEKDSNVGRSLSFSVINDLNFKQIINTILSFSNKNKTKNDRNLNKFHSSHKENKQIYMDDEYYNEEAGEQIGFKDSEVNKEDIIIGKLDLNFDINISTLNNNILKSGQGRNNLSKSNYDSFSKRSSTSSLESHNNNNLINDIVNENLKVDEVIKIILLGNSIPKKRFLNGLQGNEGFYLDGEISDEDSTTPR